MSNKTFADIIMVNERIQYQYDPKIRIEFDPSYMYLNGNAFPTGYAGSGQVLTSTSVTGILSWETPTPQGDTGLQGPQGVTGDPGGPVGQTGLQGLTGVGMPGVTGIQGLTGSQGITGAQGVTGVSGVTGISGITGLQNATGIQGQTGAQGNTGAQGYTGAQGVTGISGITGLQNATGIQGQTGAQGHTGIQGVIGNTGATGFIGYTGCISIVMNGGLGVLYTGLKGDIVIPFLLNIYKWTLYAGETSGGAFNVNLKTGNYNSFPPTASIHSGGTGPFMRYSIKNTGTTSGWTGAQLPTGSVLRYEVTAQTDGLKFNSATLALDYTK